MRVDGHGIAWARLAQLAQCDSRVGGMYASDDDCASFQPRRTSTKGSNPASDLNPRVAGRSRIARCGGLQLASPSQQRPYAVQLAVRDAQTLPELHASCPSARQYSELLHPRRE